MDYEIPDNAILYLSDAHGQYIPKAFAESILRENTKNITEEQFSILESGPYNEDYWDVWFEIENNGKIISGEKTYSIYLDGDLFFIPEENETTE